ncbi:MAG: iron-sulfur cluster assembly accessory protein [Bacteroidota bacterium]
MEKLSTKLVSLTEAAFQELKRLQVEEGHGVEKGIRIGVKGGGCSGLSYILEFDVATDMDVIDEREGLKILIDQRHALYISGMELDYQQGLNDRGFLFNNPNAESTCGCGTSFSA